MILAYLIAMAALCCLAVIMVGSPSVNKELTGDSEAEGREKTARMNDALAEARQRFIEAPEATWGVEVQGNDGTFGEPTWSVSHTHRELPAMGVCPCGRHKVSDPIERWDGDVPMYRVLGGIVRCALPN